MNTIGRVKEICDELANDNSHGYDQANRWGPDYDCSSAVSYAWQKAGVPVMDNGATFTGNMFPSFVDSGFTPIAYDCFVKLEDGDVLLNTKHHTAIYFNGLLFEATINENGQVTGGKTGDQTGTEIGYSWFYEPSYGWEWVLRYDGGNAKLDENRYLVQAGDTLWDIAEKFLGDGFLYDEIVIANNLTSELVYPGQMLVIPDTHISEKPNRTYTAEEVIAMIKEVFGVK